MAGPNGTPTQGRIRCRFPDTLIGIGNAGKRVVYHFLEQDWILEEAFAARDGEPNPWGFDAFVIDTATHDQREDERIVDRMNARIERVVEDSGRELYTVQGDVTYINPLDQTTEEFVSPAGLSSEAVVAQIAQERGLHAWWLESSEAMHPADYGRGVGRRRGLAKALLLASQTGGGALERLPREAGDSTSIVVGLGGGTGSGIVLDLARQIRNEGSGTTLFAILPAADETDQCKANAFAALSELEYLALRERNPFKNIVLLPFGPARDFEDCDPFLDGVVNAILAKANMFPPYHDNFDESWSNGPPRYAPFTMAISQILRFDIGDLQRMIEGLESYRDEKRSALDTECQLYTDILDFLVDTWGGDVGNAIAAVRNGQRVGADEYTLNDAEARSLQGRLEDLQSWLQEERYRDLDHGSIETWRDHLEQQGDEIAQAVVESDDRSLLEKVPLAPPAPSNEERSKGTVYPNQTQVQDLNSLLRDELRAIQMRATVCRGLKVVDDTAVAHAIQDAIDPAIEGGQATRPLEVRMDHIGEFVGACESRLTTLATVEECARAEMIDQHAKWWKDVRDDVEYVLELNRIEAEVASRISTLERSLTDAYRRIATVDHPESLSADVLEFDFDQLNDLLEAGGVETIDGDGIRSSLESTIDAYRSWYQIKNIGPIGAALGKKDKWLEKYRNALEETDENYVSINPTWKPDAVDREFACEFVGESTFDSRVEAFEQDRERIIDDVVERFERALSSFDPTKHITGYHEAWLAEELDMTWPKDTTECTDRFGDRLREDLDGRGPADLHLLNRKDPDSADEAGVVHEAFESAFLGPVHEQRRKLRSAKTIAEAESTKYRELRRIVREGGDRFVDFGPARPDRADVPSYEENPYVKKVSSTGNPNLRQYVDIAEAGLFRDEDGSNDLDIQTYFEQFARNVGENTDVVGLFERRIEVATGIGTSQYSDVGAPVYGEHYLHNVFMGRPFTPDLDRDNPVFDGVREALDDSGLFFRTGANGYTYETCGTGGPWDLSMTTFISGVFLDNLRAVQTPNKGYQIAYESQRDELDENVRIRHVHGVDGLDRELCDVNEGAYLYRDRLFDMQDPDDLYTILDSNEIELVDTLLGEYVRWETFPTSVDFRGTLR